MSAKRSHFSILLVALGAVAFLTTCGGGSNDVFQDTSVFLTVAMDENNNQVPVEMVKDVATTVGVVRICVDSVFNSVDVGVGTVNITGYRLSYRRTDSAGTATPPDSYHNVGLSLLYDNGTSVPSECDFIEVGLFSTDQKLYGAFAEEFRLNPVSTAEFDVTITVFGENLVGDSLEAETSATLLCAAFEPYDELLPVIDEFVSINDLMVGTDWFASWSVSGYMTGGALVDPWGNQVPLSGFDFPVGTYRINTGFLEPFEPINGSSIAYPDSILTVYSPFGVDSTTGDGVTVYARPAEPINPNNLTIEQFWASKYNLLLGESTQLNWNVYGEPNSLGLLPNVFSGVPVSFEGKNLNFDSLIITPEASVRPLLYATRSADYSEDSEFLDQQIAVSGGAGVADPEIQFFTVSHTSVPRFEQVAFFWKVTGDYEKVELFPINGVPRDVTGRESFLSPSLNRLGANAFTLSVTGINGSPVVTSSVSVDVTDEVIDQAPSIALLTQAPAATIQNGTEGAFSFQIDDPENQDCEWIVTKIAGDGCSFGPHHGEIPGGHGNALVSFVDADTNENGFLTFEVTAYDEEYNGYSDYAKKSILLVTYNTSDQAVSADAPIISNLTFTPGNQGDGLLPGQDGVISFVVSDSNSDTIYWETEIIAGDRDGLLNGEPNRIFGNLGPGGGPVTVQFQDDPDAEESSVVFKITATESGVSGSAESAVAILKVDFLTAGDNSMDFAHLGIYYYDFLIPPDTTLAIVDPNKLIPYYLNYDGTNSAVAGSFYVDNDQTTPAPYCYFVADIQHGSGDPTRVADATFFREFISPSNDNRNSGEMFFANYYDGPASVTSLPTPISDENAVSRWFFNFDVNSFYNGSSYNLPINDGQVRNYQILITATDDDDLVKSTSVVLQVENSNN